ncbi:hypothetical protein RAA17_24410 [Komagataeibacter rhaeticus]|nr:hypothetical protein [Komagataeibacter rhaeticus]
MAKEAVLMSAIDLAAISAAQTRLLAEIGKPIELLDRGTGKRMVISPADAAHPEAYLPIFLISAEALWLELTGTGFALDVSRTPDSALRLCRPQGARRFIYGRDVMSDRCHDEACGDGRRAGPQSSDRLLGRSPWPDR